MLEAPRSSFIKTCAYILSGVHPLAGSILVRSIQIRLEALGRKEMKGTTVDSTASLCRVEMSAFSQTNIVILHT